MQAPQFQVKESFLNEMHNRPWSALVERRSLRPGLRGRRMRRLRRAGPLRCLRSGPGSLRRVRSAGLLQLLQAL